MKQIVILFLLFLTIRCAALPAEETARLVILLTIDQLLPDQLERYQNDFTGGLKRLITDGVRYTNADLNYGVSETSAGFATLATGSYPQTHGIVGNFFVDRGSRQSVYSVDDPSARPVDGEGGEKSPRNLLVTTLGDWIKEASPASKVVSVSRKDRTAVLKGGHRADLVFWYSSRTGNMVTSDYYTPSLPEWVKHFNASGWIERKVPPAWTKLLPDSVYARHGPDEFESEYPWDGSTTFPHHFHPERIREQIQFTPYVDLLLLDFAWESIRAETLGQRGVVDLLCVGLSATDDIGHNFGPNSHEIHDNLVRVDRALGDFFKHLEATVGRDGILVVLTADHGVIPLPEFLVQFGNTPARRINFAREIRPHIDEIIAQLQAEYNMTEPPVEAMSFMNYAAAARAGLDSITFEETLRSELVKLDAIEDVYFLGEFLRNDLAHRPYIEHYRRSFHPERSPDFRVRFCEYCWITSYRTGTGHGSPYKYDTHIPLIFLSSHLEPAAIDRPVYLVDVAPTIAKILRIHYPAHVDGSVLEDVSDHHLK